MAGLDQSRLINDAKKCFGEALSPGCVAQYIVEFVGSFMYVLVSTAIWMTATPNDAGSLLPASIAEGLAYGMTIYAMAEMSHGHLNPVISMGHAIAKKIPWANAVFYAMAQVLGSILVCLMVASVNSGYTVSIVEVFLPFSSKTKKIGQAVIIILTVFFLMLTVLVSCDERTGRGPPGLPESLVLTASILACGGSVINPARSFAPAVVKLKFVHQALYWLCPISGAAVAALIHRHLLFPDHWTLDEHRNQLVTSTLGSAALRAYVAECIAMVFYIYVYAASTVSTGKHGGFVSAVAEGCAFGTSFYFSYFLSHGQVNPVLSFVHALGRRITVGMALISVLIQLFVSVVTTTLLRAVGLEVLPPMMVAQHLSRLDAAIIEGMFTFLLISILISHLKMKTRTHPPGMVLAMAVTACVMAGSCLNQGSMNPARAFGPTVTNCFFKDVKCHFHYQLAYWLAPVFGAAAAVLACKFVPDAAALPRGGYMPQPHGDEEEQPQNGEQEQPLGDEEVGRGEQEPPQVYEEEH